jgi:cytochrome c-type biogenesis protein CcmH
MRLIVRERLAAGDTDAQVREFLVARYGDYVLLRPPVKGDTILLWAAPVLIFLVAAAAVAVYLRQMKRADDEFERRADANAQGID